MKPLPLEELLRLRHHVWCEALSFLLWFIHQIIWTCSWISGLRYLNFVNCMYLFVFIYSECWMISFLESLIPLVDSWVLVFVLPRTWRRFFVPSCSIRMLLWMLLSVGFFQSRVPFVHSDQSACFFGLFRPHFVQVAGWIVRTGTNLRRDTVANTGSSLMLRDVTFPRSSKKVLPRCLIINRDTSTLVAWPEIRIMRMVVLTWSRLLSITLHNLFS